MILAMEDKPVKMFQQSPRNVGSMNPEMQQDKIRNYTTAAIAQITLGQDV